MRVCLLMPCGHLLGKGWPLGSRLWCLIVKLSLSHWCPWSGVVLDCIDSWTLPSFSYFFGSGRFTQVLLYYTWLKKNCNCSLARLIQACSKLFFSKCSNPNISRIPISPCCPWVMYSDGANSWLILFTIQPNSRPYRTLAMASLASVKKNLKYYPFYANGIFHKVFFSKWSKPNISRIPISPCCPWVMYSDGANSWLILFTIQPNSRPYRTLAIASLASVKN